jgi:hypothetical protein
MSLWVADQQVLPREQQTTQAVQTLLPEAQVLLIARFTLGAARVVVAELPQAAPQELLVAVFSPRLLALPPIPLVAEQAVRVRVTLAIEVV